MIKFVYFEKATKFCEISTLLLTTVHTDKSKVKILQRVKEVEEIKTNIMWTQSHLIINLIIFFIVNIKMSCVE